MGALNYKTRRNRRHRLAAELYATWTPRRLFTFGSSVGWAHWYDNPDDLYRRRNLLTYTGFSGATSGTPGTAPTDGWIFGSTGGSLSVSGGSVTFTTVGLARQFFYKPTAAATLAAGESAVFTLTVEAVNITAGSTIVAYLAVMSGSASAQTLVRSSQGVGRHSCYVTAGSGGCTVEARLGVGVSANATGTITVKEPQVETRTLTPTPYQPVPTTWEQAYLDAVGAERIFSWQDSAGTTPVTAVGQSVGLVLDRAYGGRTEESLLANGATGLTGTATAASYSTTTFAGSVSRAGDASNQSWVTWTGLVTSSIYRIRITNTGATSLYVRNGGVAGTAVAIIAAGATSYVHPLTSGGSTSITITAAANSTTATFTLSEFARVPGTHRIQASAPSRPLLMARVNTLLATEQFDHAAWTKNAQATVTPNQAVAPDGQTTADMWVALAGGNNAFQQLVTTICGAAPTVAAQTSLCLKYLSGSPWVRLMWIDGGSNQCRVWVNVQTGAVGTSTAGGTATVTGVPTPENLGNGWYRFFVRGTQPGATGYVVVVCQDGDGSVTQAAGSFYIWGADLRTADDAAKNIPAYQRVGATAADHDTDGFPMYLLYDGTDDSMASAATVDGSGSDKVTVVAGVTKNSDAAVAVVVEHGDTAGSFDSLLMAPRSAGNSGIGGDLRGGGLISTNVVASSSSLLAASSGVFSAVCDKSAATIANQLRYFKYGVGALTAGPSGTGPVTGNFFNATMYYGGRGPALGGGLRFNGREYGGVGRFGPMSETERNRLESWFKTQMRMP